ncbi:Alkaline phosphatase synthesis sensor protein PhoR [Aquisphaera giovannonii]|uniref:Alkaline phosphatase synthesis sensor protein PhoR n=1 Tax=Aquisphaera giovannonii TaxID=406548 RepID=A0A5B9W0Y2_9BACT|nr:CheR family methyltransferase [Aquisphaera giovannonii]QEH33625.1 Alkaline phosphatase synthesis sensor protein PhoR [Aquisphaera giovannonii]
MSDPSRDLEDKAGPRSARTPSLVVGIGVARGGEDALTALFRVKPRHTGLAFVVVLPDDTALDIDARGLSGLTGLPAFEARDGDLLRADHAYLARPGSSLGIRDGAFEVNSPGPEDGERAIDVFFQSLAEDRQAGAIGIMLAGDSPDGTLGLKAISDAGGLTLVEDVGSAAFDGRPRSEVNLGMADRALPPERMIPEVLAYAEHLQSLLVGDQGGVVEDQIGGHLGEICDLLEERTGHNFKHYRTSTLARRIGRKMQVHRIESAADYLDRLERDPDEVQDLFRELLIGVTCFFRDPDSFDRLQAAVIAPLLKDRGPDDPVRVWVPGCATGEEAYTLAILFREELERCANPIPVQIFATDINASAVARARRGNYPASIADDLTPDRLKRFFEPAGRGFAAAREIRDLCVFSQHNLIRDPPFSRLDLISCRNLLIYLGLHLQKKLFPLFHFALRPGGFLFLGPAEGLASHEELFKAVDPKARISRRLDTAVRSPAGPPVPEGSRTPSRVPEGTAGPATHDLPLLMQRIVLDEFAPRSLVVREDGQILCTSSGVERYLGIAEGIFQNDVVKLARSGLRLAIRSALAEAVASRRTVKNKEAVVRTPEGVERIGLTVQPMPELGEAGGLFLIVFDNLGLQAEPGESVLEGVGEKANALIEHLEQELRKARGDLEQTVQDIEAANEELKSANEELLSMNEELRAANEELETSREQLQVSNEALTRTNTDLENLLASTRIATLFLDREARIQRFTPAVADIYNVIPGDVGRSLSDITHRAASMPPLPSMDALAAGPVEDEVRTSGGRWFIRRVHPYRDADGNASGLVVTFVDVSDLKEAEASVRDREARLALALDAGGMATWEWDLATTRLEWSEHVFALLGLPPGRGPVYADDFYARVHPQDVPAVRAAFLSALESGKEYYQDEFRIVRPDGSERWLAGKGKVFRDELGTPVRMLGVHFDITDRKRFEDRLRQSEAQFRTLADTIPQLAWIADADGEVLWFNWRWYDYTGTTPQHLQDRGWRVVHDPEVLGSVLARWEESLRSGEPFEMVFPIRRADGVYRSFLTRGEPIRDDSGNVVRWVGTNTDIEDQKRAEDDLRLANHHKDEFLAILAHELRNPLSPIRNAVHLLRLSGSTDPTLVGAREMIDRQVTNLVRLVDDLMDVSRINRGKIELRKRPTDLRSVIESAVESARPLIQSKGHGLSVAMPPQPFVLEADPARLSQVVLNLLNNSAKYTDEGGSIAVSMERDNGKAVVRIRDNGVGLAPELLPRIFDLYTQAERTLDRSLGGLGIGLTIVRRLVEMHGGTVEAHSEGLGRGSEFVIRLPLAAEWSRRADAESRAV